MILKDEATSVPAKRTKPVRWPDYATLWRWHFYAGVLSIPIVLVLSITGTIYLFRPQIDAWQERAFDRLETSPDSMRYAEQVRAAEAATGGWLACLEVESEPQTKVGFSSATRVIIEANGKRLRCYVDPANARVLQKIHDDDRLTRFVRKIHGSLLLGPRGSYLVEIVASWTVVLVVTGLLLWVPPRWRWAGVMFPRLNRRGKTLWKDLHSVTGFWASSLILFLVFTGLPWSTFWGDYFKSARRWTGTSVAKQDWDGGHKQHSKEAKGKSPWRSAGVDPSTYDINQIDHVAVFAKSLDWLPPVEIAPPSDGTSVWTIRSMTANRPHRQTFRYDAERAKVVHRELFTEKHWVDQLVGNGIALHEGQRFVDSRWGWVNQAAALLATGSLVCISLTGIVLWLRRRPSTEALGGSRWMPPPPKRGVETFQEVSPARKAVFIGCCLGLSLLLPLFGATLLVILFGDWVYATLVASR